MKKLIALLGGIMLTGASANVLAGVEPPPPEPDLMCNESVCVEGYDVSLKCLNLTGEVEGGLYLNEPGLIIVDVHDEEGPVCGGFAEVNLAKQELKCTNALKGSNDKGKDKHSAGEKEVEAEIKFTECEEEEEEL